MPRGPPRLDVDVKLKHVQQSRKRYEEQLKYRERSAMHSEKYRDRKAAEERRERSARNAVNKPARELEEQQLRKDHKAMAKPQQRPAPITIRGAPLKAAKWHAASPTTPTPTPRRRTAIPAVVTASKDDPSEDESDEESTRCRLEAPAWPKRASRPVW
ncbi:hypothetical protein DFH07DRAFT_953868 [Mycena maculata]|uniref:Uncharacterized protein n=1 Tax=Mycena maculata TaxID=230809 RepID=A0AAD7JWH2_9AGAR|nr:hypothetical protein DFH07DRAFT_953868 [Mycena maculata]